MTDEKTDVDYYVLLAGISSCCEEGFRQGVHFMQTNIIPQKEQLAKIEVLESLLDDYTSSGCNQIGYISLIEIYIDRLKAGNC